MKKLMLLGGTRYLLPVIEAAHKLGCYVITCDYLPDNFAHKYSDKYVNVSIIDKEAVLDVAKKLDIDGIMSFACDPGVVTAAYVADKLGLPSCGPYESVCILQNKSRFRKFLSDNGFYVPVAKGYTSVDEALNDIGLFHWPVIVKPTDSAGSKGVTRVDDPEKLRESIEYALSFSHCDEFIIEDFIVTSKYTSGSDCFSTDGELSFVSFSSQRFDSGASNPYTPTAHSWPSNISDENQAELVSELNRLLKLLNMTTSLYNVEAREGVDGKVYLMEVSPRAGGNRLSEVLRYATGVDLIENAVKAALGEETNVIQKPYDGHWALIVLHSDESGIFDSLTVSDFIKDKIVECSLWKEQGDKVNSFSAANESIGTLFVRFDTADELDTVMKNIKDHVKINLK